MLPGHLATIEGGGGYIRPPLNNNVNNLPNFNSSGSKPIYLFIFWNGKSKLSLNPIVTRAFGNYRWGGVNLTTPPLWIILILSLPSAHLVQNCLLTLLLPGHLAPIGGGGGLIRPPLNYDVNNLSTFNSSGSKPIYLYHGISENIHLTLMLPGHLAIIDGRVGVN